METEPWKTEWNTKDEYNQDKKYSKRFSSWKDVLTFIKKQVKEDSPS